MNGTMEEPVDIAHSSPQDTVKKDATKAEASEAQSENSMNEDSNHMDSSSNDDFSEHGHNNGGEDDLPKPSIVETPSDVPEQKVISEDTVNNHCSNSNDSSAESVASSLGQSEKAGQDKDETNKDTQNFQGIESGDESESDDDSLMSGGLKATDTVSIDSDSEEDGDDSSQGSRTKSKNSDIIILDAENRPGSINGNSRGSGSPEIHEITSDNEECNISNSTNTNEPRRSNRTTKRKMYGDMINGDDESDIEEVEMDDPLAGKAKSISVSDPKAIQRWEILERLEMAAKAKADQDNQKDSGVGKIPQNVYQSMVARGLIVTPTTSSSKTSTSTQVSPVLQTPQAAILPSLTDDMFVVEAPSFIVPYVYEKPSVEPFRDFVDNLGQELEEMKAKEENERLLREKEEKEKREKDRKERRERGEEVEDSPDESVSVNQTNESVDDEKKKKKAEKKARRRRRDDDDASWDGESSSDSEDETLSDNDTVVLKDKMDSIEDIKHVTQLTADKVLTPGKTDNYFDCSLGKFFVDIGMNLVQEYVQNDLLKQQNRKLYREKKSGHSTKATLTSIASLTKNLDFSKENNAPYTFTQKKCGFCSFRTESDLIMKNHLETPHMKNNLYKCNFCEFEVKSPHDILCHMEAKHNVRGRLERALAYHQCPNCPFEDNGKGKLARHQIACAKKFKPEQNLTPPIEWEPPAKIPKITRARSTGTSPYQTVLKGPIGALGRGVMAGGFRARGRSPGALGAPARATPLAGAPLVRGGLMLRHNAPAPSLVPNNYPLANNGKPKSMHQPSISITPLPHQPQPVQVPHQTTSKSTFVICEICDGYIKDLEQLRNHMQWIHKVKIHPKMIYNRPPLNCQKCQFRFFTDQGLERHLLGSHGLVTSSMQEAANKGKDAGRCPVCGRVYQWKLLNHVARDHNLTLKPAHLSYKCTVCTATFGMYKQFENHVYSAHSVVAKRVMDKTKTSSPVKPTDSLLKPIKIRDEITITAQTVKPQTSAKK